MEMNTTRRDGWDALSLREKSEMMKVAVQNGIYNLDDIRKAYNEYAEGGPLVEAANRFAMGGNDETPKTNNEHSWSTRLGLWLLDKMGVSNYTKGSPDDTQYRQNLYNRIDPTAEIPGNMEDIFWKARDVVQAKMEDSSKYRRDYEDPVANAGWAKRLELPYDKTYLIDNEDGSVRLPAFVEAEIPTDTLALKSKLENNRKLRDRYDKLGGLSYDRQQAIDAAIKADSIMLEGLRKVYNNPGEKAVVNEHSFNNRSWIDNGNVVFTPSPLNIMKNYTISYDKDKNALNYFDVYDFNALEPFVPGEPYEIKGSIELKR